MSRRHHFNLFATFFLSLVLVGFLASPSFSPAICLFPRSSINSERRLLCDVAQMEMDAEMPFRFRIMICPIRRPLDEKEEERSTLSHWAILGPRTYYQTAPPADLIRATRPIPEDSYIKIGRPFYFDADNPERGATWPTMIHEARICEVLMKHPHRNVAEYYGYVEKDGLMAGLCFKRYGQTLRDAVEQGTLKAGDMDFVLDEIGKGIQHIHSLGLVHNDINLANILLDADNATPIIIDFDSCYKTGASMDYNGGTFPWSNDARTAEFENDDFGLDKVKEWMKETLVEKTCP
ncbi:kinase-like domain-containing protein [Armillaria borealis]|uniref:Kinase-like domain-containing protein n=1 Tax=Armillaria borealis TaxID=47425 RepID=A0AA39IZQ4_9AGAR|nr:kinase-like domain-containing protein [Armillaria borealis]